MAKSKTVVHSKITFRVFFPHFESHPNGFSQIANPALPGWLRAQNVEDPCLMNSVSITCPYCWQTIDIEEPLKSETTVQFVTDCEVCCRPILVTADWEPDEDTPYLSVEPES